MTVLFPLLAGFLMGGGVGMLCYAIAELDGPMVFAGIVIIALGCIILAKGLFGGGP